jgi:hypothetical protein
VRKVEGSQNEDQDQRPRRLRLWHPLRRHHPLRRRRPRHRGRLIEDEKAGASRPFYSTQDHWKERDMKIKTNIRAGLSGRCGGTRCGGGVQP